MNTDFRPYRWVVFATAAFAIGCGNEHPQKPASATPAPAPAPPPAAPDDKSLTTEEYVQLGMPAPDRAWTPEDMAKAAKVLSKLCQETPAKLPRYLSPRSGAVFARITSDENVRRFADGSPPIDVAVNKFSSYFSGLQAITQLYLARDLISSSATEESIEMCGCMLRLMP